ncbi:MAG: hypothetical protein C4534_08790 [Gaiellales bacterium]|nr:MAG: hypothetical protein C4534_08790 [Gaiellales bacterium]
MLPTELLGTQTSESSMKQRQRIESTVLIQSSTAPGLLSPSPTASPDGLAAMIRSTLVRLPSDDMPDISMQAIHAPEDCGWTAIFTHALEVFLLLPVNSRSIDRLIQNSLPALP